MSLTKANFRMIDGVGENVLDHGAVGDGVTDDSAAILAAIAAAGSYGIVIFPPSITGFAREFNVGTTTIQFLFGQTVHGNHAQLNYSGLGAGIECADFSPTVWAQRCAFYGLIVNATATGANVVGWRVNASYSIWVDCAVSVQGNLATAWLIDADFTNGSGSYYNSFHNCDAVGKMSINPGVVTQQGWRFNRSDAAPTRGPNANSFMGGRTSQFFNSWEICGAGNSIFQPIVEGTHGTGFTIDNDAVGSTGAGCHGNVIFGGYFEGSSLENPDVFNVGANYALETSVVRPFITSFGGGAIFIDQGTFTAYDTGSEKSGTFVPVLTTSSGAVIETYAANGQLGSFINDRGRVSFQITITVTTRGASWGGIMKITGLPLAATTATSKVQSAYIGFMANGTGYAAGHVPTAHINPGATEIFIRTSNGIVFGDTQPVDGFQMSISGTYLSDS